MLFKDSAEEASAFSLGPEHDVADESVRVPTELPATHWGA